MFNEPRVTRWCTTLKEGRYESIGVAIRAWRAVARVAPEFQVRGFKAIEEYYKLPKGSFDSNHKLTLVGFKTLLERNNYSTPQSAFQAIYNQKWASGDTEVAKEAALTHFNVTMAEVSRQKNKKKTTAAKKAAKTRQPQREREPARKAARRPQKKRKVMHAVDPVEQAVADVVGSVGSQKISIGLAKRIASLSTALRGLIEEARAEGLDVNGLLAIALA